MCETESERRIVIVGGGIIGCTTAYYLTQHPAFDKRRHYITVVEAENIAAGASGKAGGLLATWAYPPALAQLSFKLHAELASKHDGEDGWGYRRVSCAQISMHRGDLDSLPFAERMEELGKRKMAPNGLSQPVPKELDWIDHHTIDDYEELSDESSSAQVNPYQFTSAMARLSQKRGVRYIMGSVEEVMTGGEHAQAGVKGVKIRRKSSSKCEIMAADVVVVAAGPWTTKLLPEIRVGSRRAYKITLATNRQLSAHCLFARVASRKERYSGSGSSRSISNIEIYSRPGKELYICSSGGQQQSDPSDLSMDDNAEEDEFCQAILEVANSVSEVVRSSEITSRRVGFLPISDNGHPDGPIIGETHVSGLLVATGHGTWGIQNAPATGLLLSEIIFDGKAHSANIKALSPKTAPGI